MHGTFCITIFKSGMFEWNVSNAEVKTIKVHFEGRFTQGAYITIVRVFLSSDKLNPLSSDCAVFDST